MSKHLFPISSTNTLLETLCSRDVISSLVSYLSGAERLVLNCYRAGQAIAEMVVHFPDDRVFCLTIQEGHTDYSPLTKEDIRVSHMHIGLPDMADILVLITQLIRKCHFNLAINDDPTSASLMVLTPSR